MTDDPINPVKEEEAALDRIARTRDGVLLHRFLRRTLETVYDFQDDGALRTQNGRRTLARDLMRLMAQGIEGTSDRADAAILTRSGTPTGTRAGSRAEQRRAAFARAAEAESKPT